MTSLRNLAPLSREGGENPAKVVEDLRDMMQEKVGIIRQGHRKRRLKNWNYSASARRKLRLGVPGFTILVGTKHLKSVQ